MSSIIPGLAVVVVGFFKTEHMEGVCWFVVFGFFPNKYLFRYCQMHRLILKAKAGLAPLKAEL